ncbi:hypothetical protein Pcinc_030054 [Petrolisthes cinctipes]|uniref:Uncharacterized protein n=1 Tax=Petrolisthes cinctipes TaxID=88211 RepID=A0AAE1EZQ6_PETCI|nr:hypothetical protein Pcinc_030054 [Petrolisthes cinctipes]
MWWCDGEGDEGGGGGGGGDGDGGDVGGGGRRNSRLPATDTKPYKTSPLSSPVPHPSTYIDTKPYKTSPLSSPVPYPSAYIDAKPCKTSPLSSPVPNLTTCVETKPFTTSPVSIAEAKYTPHHLHLETKPCKKSPLSSPVSVTPMYSPFLSKHTSLSSHAFLPNNSSRPMPPLQPLNNIGYSYQSISQPHQYLPQTQPLSLCMPRPQARSPQPLPQPRSPLQPLLPKKRPRSEVFEEEDCLVSPPVSPDMPDTPFFPAHMAHKRKIARWSVASSPIFPTPSPSITSSPPLPLTPTSVAIPALIRMPHEVCSEGGVLASYTSTLAAGKEWDALHYKNAFLNSHRGTSTLYSSLPSALAIHPSHYSSSRHNNYHHVKRQRAHTPSRTSLIHSTASIRPSAVPAAHPDSYYRDRTRLKEAPTSPASSHQSLSRPTNTWSGGAMIPTLPPHPPRPTPLSSGESYMHLHTH